MRLSFLACISIFAAGAAHADATRDALAEIAKCAEIADASERLKCFDNAMPRARSALAPPAEPAGGTGSLLEWFGFSAKQKPVVKTEDFGKPPVSREPAEITEIKATVIEFAKTLRGRAVFILDNGQVWRQMDSDSTDVRGPAPGAPMKVTIEVGALGSYNLTVDGTNGLVKVSRLK